MENQVMMKNYSRLGVGLVTLFAFGLGVSPAFSQVFVLPGGDTWSSMAAALDPETDDIMVAGTGITSFGEFVASQRFL